MRTEVVVVGGGPAGLAMAALLGRAGVSTVLVERRESTVTHPQAHVVNARTMELFRVLGIADQVRDAAIPALRASAIGWVTRMTGLELGSIDLDDDLAVQASQSPELLCSCPQDQLEPILSAAAGRYPSVELRYGVEAAGFDQSAGGVSVELLGGGRVEADYLVAADGAHSPIRRALGVPLEDEIRFGEMLNLYFHADLRLASRERPYLLWWVANPETQGVFVALNGVDRWVYHSVLAPGETVDQYPSERCERIVRAAVGDPGIALELNGVRPWRLGVGHASRYRVGRAYLVGDAAHTFPPTGGFGMNTGIQDAHNLAWKLAAVLRGQAQAPLLDTYEEERKPVAVWNAQQSVANVARMASTGAGIVSDPSRVGELADIEGPAGAPLREKIAAAIPEQRDHFRFQGQTFGFSYASAGVLPDGSPPPPQSVAEYTPSGRPGGRAPHCWLIGAGGRRLSTIDLTDGRWVLLAGEEGSDWQAAAVRLAGERSLDLDAFTVGTARADLRDEEGTWADRYGVTSSGAVLIRPDGHVGFRGRARASDPRRELTAALDVLTGRSAAQEVTLS